MILVGVVAVVVLAGIVALFVGGLFGAGVALLTMFFLTAYIALLSTPVWLAAILDDVEDHADELRERD